MSKKKRRVDEVLAKKRQLQNLERQNTPSPTVVTTQSTPVEQVIADSTVKPTTHYSNEIYRTLIDTAIIAILLVIAFFISQKTSYSTQLGNWLFTFLRLKSS